VSRGSGGRVVVPCPRKSAECPEERVATIGEMVQEFLHRKLWPVDAVPLEGARGGLIKVLRVMYVVGRDLAEGQLTLRAMSLVYTTLLSMVPLLAVSFSVLKAFGVHNQVEPALENFMAALGPQGKQITASILGFVDKMKVGVLGFVGLALLIYTVISLVQKIESAFNYTWRIKRTRGFTQAFSDYISVILIGPVLVFTAMGLTASVMSTTVAQAVLAIEPFGTLAYYVGRLVPYLLVCAAFTFVYVFVPNTKVRLRAALVGGLCAGVLWQATGWVFASFVVSSTKYEAIYSGFAILIMFMIWLYVSWLILLLGAQLAFYYQHPHLVTPVRVTFRLSHSAREKLGMAAMFLVAEGFYRGSRQWTVDALAERLQVDTESIDDIAETLKAKGLLTVSGEKSPALLPARDLESIALVEVLEAMRAPAVNFRAVRDVHIAPVEHVMAEVDASLAGALKDRTLKNLVLAERLSRVADIGS
jgi:membrane protein